MKEALAVIYTALQWPFKITRYIAATRKLQKK
jgi:hypothetical protein